MKRGRYLAGLAAVVVVALVLVVAPSSNASETPRTRTVAAADEPPDDFAEPSDDVPEVPEAVLVEAAAQCPHGRFCVWTDSPFRGRFAYFECCALDLREPIGGYVFNDQITDVWNRTGWIWRLYEHHATFGVPRCKGRLLRIAPDYKGFIGGRYNFNDLTSCIWHERG